MAIDTSGTVSVAEAARRLNRSTEQVRRYLREGKLAGHRVGNQWFVEERALADCGQSKTLIPGHSLDRVEKLRRKIYRRAGSADILSWLADVREP